MSKFEKVVLATLFLASATLFTKECVSVAHADELSSTDGFMSCMLRDSDLYTMLSLRYGNDYALIDECMRNIHESMRLFPMSFAYDGNVYSYYNSDYDYTLRYYMRTSEWYIIIYNVNIHAKNMTIQVNM